MYPKSMTVRVYGQKIQCVVTTIICFPTWMQQAINIS